MATKFQVTLPDELAHELKHAAAERGVPLAEWIRTAMRQELQRAAVPVKKGSHWLDRIRVDDAPDTARRADEILYGEPRASRKQ